jgi:hypothetical protein
MRREDRSSISSQFSRRPRRELGFAVLRHRCAFSVPFLCSCHKGRSFAPACRSCGAPRAGAVKTGRSRGHPQGLALTAPSTVPPSCRLGRRRVRLDAFERAFLVENRPSNAGKLIGERDRQHVVVQSLFLAASIQALSPYRSQPLMLTSTEPSARTGPADSDCRAGISIPGSCGLRSRFAWAPVRARRRSRAPL